jgi:hypothetical protein
MQLSKSTNNNSKTEKTEKKAAPPAKETSTAKPDKVKKTALERAFITAANVTRAADKLDRMAGTWKSEDQTTHSLLETLRRAIGSMASGAEAAKKNITTLAQSGFKPKGGYVGPKTAFVVGSRVTIKPKQLAKRFDFLTEDQQALLYIKSEDPRGFLVVCRDPLRGTVETIIGYLKKGALLAAPEEVA